MADGDVGIGGQDTIVSRGMGGPPDRLGNGGSSKYNLAEGTMSDAKASETIRRVSLRLRSTAPGRAGGDGRQLCIEVRGPDVESWPDRVPER